MKSFLRSAKCPSCERAESVLAVSSVPPGGTCEWDVMRDTWRGFFKRKVILSYHRCQHCGLLYAPQYFTEEALIALYSSMPDNTAGMSADLIQATQRGYYEFFASHTDFRGDYLELGPDTGVFTRFVAENPGEGRLWLYEPNQAIWPHLRNLSKTRPIEIRAEMNDYSAVADGSLRSAAMVHVLDHLTRPKDNLIELRRKFTRGGKVLIVTHDESSLLARVLGVRWPAYCLQHPHLFNPRTTHTFLAQCGFQVINTQKSVNHFPLSYLTKHFLYAVGAHRLSEKIKGDFFPLPLKLGNIMTVAEAV